MYFKDSKPFSDLLKEYTIIIILILLVTRGPSYWDLGQPFVPIIEFFLICEYGTTYLMYGMLYWTNKLMVMVKVLQRCF